MDNNNLHLYNEYQDFYMMSKDNDVFSRYCQKVFGIDFSQDGFSDITQIKDLIAKSNINNNSVVLDIGCGNGDMCEYIHDTTGAVVYGFDYSQTAIETAKNKFKAKNDSMFFDVGIIGQKQYAPAFFDVILSVDTMYFATDLKAFIRQLYEWLKPQGVFAAFYSEFRFDEKTPTERLRKDNTQLAEAFQQLKLSYEAFDYTEKHFEHMKHKRAVALEMKDEFLRNGLEQYSNNAINQSIDIETPYEKFIDFSSRYIYIIRKP